MEPVIPSTGWGVTHLYYRVQTNGLAEPALAGKELVAALEAFTAAPDHQILCSSVLGLKADLGIMAIGPDLVRHDTLTRDLSRGSVGRALIPVDSYVSVTEVSEYMETPDAARERLTAQHGPEAAAPEIAAAEARLAKYREDKLHPRLPDRKLLAFYPMSKARESGVNWYRLPFDERRRLMQGHAVVGRRYAGRILQLITASTGLDRHEWAVTLLSDDLAAIKEIVYEMRFDEVTASYGRFDTFHIGLTLPHTTLPQHLNLT